MTISNLPVISGEDDFKKYLREISKFPMLEADDEYMLAKRWVESGDYQAAQKLVTSHLRLVAKIASNFKGYGLPMADIVSEGNIGLMQAVKKFDPERGFRLSTYSMWWIKAAIQEYILRSWSLVKIGTSATQKRLFFNLRKIKNRIQKMNLGELTPENRKIIANKLNVNEKDVIDMDRRMIASDQYLDAPIKNEDGDMRAIDMLPSNIDNSEVEYAKLEEKQQRSSFLKQAITKLNTREKEIITRRKLSENPSTLEDLSKIFKVSRERIRQIEVRAMEKLSLAANEMALLN